MTIYTNTNYVTQQQIYELGFWGLVNDKYITYNSETNKIESTNNTIKCFLSTRPVSKVYLNTE